MEILEELPEEEVRAYLIGKYGLEFAEKTMQIIMRKAQINN
jgi:hypothetical protein